jgi:hypothetical protein
MTQSNSVVTIKKGRASFLPPVLLGAGIAFSLILLFVQGVETPKPEWGKLWEVKPLVITPLAGAFAGALFHFISAALQQRGWKGVFAYAVGAVLFFFVLWIGVVLGLSNTLWD